MVITDAAAYVLSCLTVLIACIVGKICGMGGGVIIKPVLDGLGLFSVSTINFLSGCTVIGMSAWSLVMSNRKSNSSLDLQMTVPLAIGAAAGGVLGKLSFQWVSALFPDPNMAGGVQAICLFLVTLGCFFYTIHQKKIETKNVKNPVICVAVGFVLGCVSAFLGIGGGPINMIFLFYFFSMPIKKAAQNSLFVILISQSFAMARTLVSAGFPDVPAGLWVGMMLSGIAGSIVGTKTTDIISDKKVSRLFGIVMCVVMGICLYNAWNFFGQTA